MSKNEKYQPINPSVVPKLTVEAYIYTRRILHVFV